VARKLSYPSWKVIVSASGGQYLKPGSLEPGFFLRAQLFVSPFFARSKAALIRRARRHGSVIMIWLIALPDDKPSTHALK
jgi:hypothetical protein